MTEIDRKTWVIPEPSDVRFIRGIYWFLVVCGLLFFTAMCAEKVSADKLSTAKTTFTMTPFYVLILFGLHKRKCWIVSMILYFSAWMLVSNFVRLVGETASTGAMMEHKAACFLLALLSLYQLHVFRKKETELYFRESGQTLF